jgi:transcriptional regulator with XRE-family HTH domain
MAAVQELRTLMTDRSSDEKARFAADLERLRAARGWSVEELATRSQLGLEELQAILRGERHLSLDVIVLLARGLDVPPGELIDGTAGAPGGD